MKNMPSQMPGWRFQKFWVGLDIFGTVERIKACLAAMLEIGTKFDFYFLRKFQNLI